MNTPAAILVEQRKPLVLDEVRVPEPGFGQVLVEILATRICGSQIGEIDGVKGPDRWLPHLLGHEAAATVRAVGPEVRHAKVGDRVVCHWRPGRGLEARPALYDWNGRTVNAGCITTFQRHAILSENRVTVVPPDTDPAVCCLLADTLTTGFGAIHHDAGVEIGEAVVVIGCGGIGLGTVLGAHLAGAHPVIAVDLHEHKLEKARAFGATHTVNSSSTDFAAAVLDLLGGQRPEVVIDGTGQPAVLEKALALTALTGRCIGVGVGVMPHDRTLSFNTLQLHLGKRLAGSHGGSSLRADEIPRYLRMMRAGRFDPRGMISHRISLDQVNDGVARMRSGEVIHCLIEFPRQDPTHEPGRPPVSSHPPTAPATPPAAPISPTLDELDQVARRLRLQLVRMSHQAGTPHLGSALSCIDLLVAAYWTAVRIDPAQPLHPLRDRFILSKGHAATALYAVLAERGFFPREWLDTFASHGAPLAEQPAPACAPGVELATGSLGHGLPVGLGMALAARLRSEPWRVFVCLSDGECNEGSVWEAALFAAAQKLERLVVLVDYNKWQATGRSDEVMALPSLRDKWAAFGWNATELDGHDLAALTAALARIPDGSGKPVAIIAHTVKGKGISFMEDDNNWHYRIPKPAEVEEARRQLGIA